jgi:hypothetical protein
MGRCVKHTDVETSYHCMKHDLYLCEDCLTCRDPKIHCKYRQSCVIWFMDKRGGKDVDKKDEQRISIIE